MGQMSVRQSIPGPAAGRQNGRKKRRYRQPRKYNSAANRTTAVATAAHRPAPHEMAAQTVTLAAMACHNRNRLTAVTWLQPSSRAFQGRVHNSPPLSATSSSQGQNHDTPGVGFREKNTTPATPTTSVKARASPPYQTPIQRPAFAASARYLRSIGKAGGRPAKGRYDQLGLFMPGGITVDKNGQLWVAEVADAPKRISVWDAKTGGFKKEFFGGCDYFAYGFIDPQKPAEILVHNVLWKVDWKNYKVTPETTIWRKTAPEMVPPLGTGSYAASPKIITAETKQAMREMLTRIQTGEYAKSFILENRAGAPTLMSRRRLTSEHSIEVVGEKLRAMMPWIKANKLVDRSRN